MTSGYLIVYTCTCNISLSHTIAYERNSCTWKFIIYCALKKFFFHIHKKPLKIQNYAYIYRINLWLTYDQHTRPGNMYFCHNQRLPNIWLTYKPYLGVRQKFLNMVKNYFLLRRMPQWFKRCNSHVSLLHYCVTGPEGTKPSMDKL